MSYPTVVFGAAGLNPGASFSGEGEIPKALSLLSSLGVKNIDTARLYGESEKTLGDNNAADNFVIDSKLLGGWKPGSVTKQGVIDDVKDSVAKTKVKQFDIMYIHGPDNSVPFEETLEGINEAYKSGGFKRFGLSNFSTEQVQQVYDIAKSKGYVLPTVYQANYSAVARKLETTLFPTLRKLGIALYAYSPIAGGFLTKTPQQIKEGVGRFNEQAIGGLYHRLYNKPSYLEALAKWNEVADKEGITKAELAYRWVAYHSAIKKDLGDAVIFGASNFTQIEQTVKAIKAGPLSKEAVNAIEEVWKIVEADAPVDNFVGAFGKHD